VARRTGAAQKMSWQLVAQRFAGLSRPTPTVTSVPLGGWPVAREGRSWVERVVSAPIPSVVVLKI